MASLACAASSRILAAMPRRCGSQPKISKTTPCKVAGGRWQGRFGVQYLTRRANQRHSFIVAQSVKRPWARDGAPFGVVLGENPHPRLKLHLLVKLRWLVKLQWLLKLQWSAAARDRPRIAEPPRLRRACRWHAAQHSRRQSPSRATHSRLSPGGAGPEWRDRCRLAAPVETRRQRAAELPLPR
jgi:hypothetical protein